MIHLVMIDAAVADILGTIFTLVDQTAPVNKVGLSCEVTDV